VTYKQSQFAARYRGLSEKDAILLDATLIRTYGTRLPICEKNVGQAKYAFNSVSRLCVHGAGESEPLILKPLTLFRDAAPSAVYARYTQAPHEHIGRIFERRKTIWRRSN